MVASRNYANDRSCKGRTFQGQEGRGGFCNAGIDPVVANQVRIRRVAINRYSSQSGISLTHHFAVMPSCSLSTSGEGNAKPTCFVPGSNLTALVGPSVLSADETVKARDRPGGPLPTVETETTGLGTVSRSLAGPGAGRAANSCRVLASSATADADSLMSNRSKMNDRTGAR